jgi:hypothetical protein
MSTAQKRKRFVTATFAMKSVVRTESLSSIQIITVCEVNIILLAVFISSVLK